METFEPPKQFVHNPRFQTQKKALLSGIASESIDPPLAGLITRLNDRSCIFTLQCCFGHFLHKANRDPMNTEALPPSQDIRRVDYKIAYLAFCLDESPSGQKLYRKLEGLTAVDPDYIQFGSALWFWERQVNSYVLQVEPERFKRKDTARLSYGEALRVEKARNDFFARLAKVILKEAGCHEL